MPRNTSISLSDHFAGFIDAQVATGRYASASEVVRAGLRRLEEDERRLTELRAALVAGMESGEAEPWDLETFLAERHAEAGG